MPSSISSPRWLVAVDPFSDMDQVIVRQIVQTLEQKIGNAVSPTQIELTYVLAPASFNWSGDFNGNWFEKYQPMARAKLELYLPSMDAKRTVLTCQESGVRASVHTLVEYAKKSKVNGIVVSTHARKGLERMALGSFAETLILASPVSVLVLNPLQQAPVNIQKLLVPLDLSQPSDEYISAVTQLAKSLKAEVTLFYKQADLLDPIVQQGVYSLGGGWISVQDYVNTEMASYLKVMEKYEVEMRREGVVCNHTVDSSPEGLLPSIIKAANTCNAGMITVLSRSGALSTVLLGSVARGLVRTSPVPVMVLREGVK